MATCSATGKRQLTREEATEEAERWRRESLARMNAYKCNACGAFHIGNDWLKPKRRR